MHHAKIRPPADAKRARGLFLDLDGTLADSLTSLKELYFSFLAELGAQGSEDEFQALNGPPLRRVVESLKQNHSLPGELSDLIEGYMVRLNDAHKRAPPTEGARSAIQWARERGWRVAVVTSSPRAAAVAWLRRNSLVELIDSVVGGDEVARGKPAPEPYCLALARTGCACSTSIAVEDSSAGARAAVAAGLTTFVLGRRVDRTDWPKDVSFIEGFADLKKELGR